MHTRQNKSISATKLNSLTHFVSNATQSLYNSIADENAQTASESHLKGLTSALSLANDVEIVVVASQEVRAIF